MLNQTKHAQGTWIILHTGTSDEALPWGCIANHNKISLMSKIANYL